MTAVAQSKVIALSKMIAVAQSKMTKGSYMLFIAWPGHAGAAAPGEARRGPWQRARETPTQHYQVAKEGNGAQHTGIDPYKVKIRTKLEPDVNNTKRITISLTVCKLY